MLRRRPIRGWSGRWVVAVAVAVVVLFSAPPSAAQEESPDPVPREGWADPTRSWPDPLADTGLGVEATYYRFQRMDGRSLLPVASAERPLSVYVGGDSLSGGPAFGFEALIADDPAYRLTTEVRLSTGVITEWYFDWVAHLREVVSAGGYDVVVLSMGGNDAQRFRGFGDAVGSPEWQARYQARVADMLAAVDSPGRLVIWLGMPAVSVPALEGLPAVVNPLSAAAAGSGRRFAYADASAVVAPEGVFTRVIVDADGRELEVREGDGIHYTRVGGELLGHELLEIIAGYSG